MEILDKLKNLISSTLQKTDHVHFSEFLSEEDKKIITEQRDSIWNKYQNIKKFILDNKQEDISIYLENLESCLDRGDSLNKIFEYFGIEEPEELTE
ncbi:MAG: hypothetical protein CMP21_04105 [Rickettsiales bacterium]|nr:hypothetical protein [Rickettsiales bacterium]